MLKKLIPLVMLVFVTACSTTHISESTTQTKKMPCCEKHQHSKNKKCGKHHKDHMCEMCREKMKGMSSIKEGEHCPMKKKGAHNGQSCGCCQHMMKEDMMKDEIPDMKSSSTPKTHDEADHNADHPAH